MLSQEVFVMTARFPQMLPGIPREGKFDQNGLQTYWPYWWGECQKWEEEGTAIFTKSVRGPHAPMSRIVF